MFREGYEVSKFGEQVEAYACVYTSRVSNFRFYSPMQYFRGPRDRMPHERDPDAPREPEGPRLKRLTPCPPRSDARVWRHASISLPSAAEALHQGAGLFDAQGARGAEVVGDAGDNREQGLRGEHRDAGAGAAISTHRGDEPDDHAHDGAGDDDRSTGSEESRVSRPWNWRWKANASTEKFTSAASDVPRASPT